MQSKQHSVVETDEMFVLTQKSQSESLQLHTGHSPSNSGVRLHLINQPSHQL